GEGAGRARRLVSSPYDVAARSGTKSTTTWIGSKVHLTETCEDEAPHLIVPVATAPAPAAAGEVTPATPEGLRGADLLPGERAVDTASVDREVFAARDLTIDGGGEPATCPEGRASVSWSP